MSYSLSYQINIKKGKVDSKKVLNEISKDMRKTVISRFRNSLAPDGTHWAGISHRTGKPLWISGSLARSLKRNVTNTKAIIKTDDIRARIHQHGGIIRAKNSKYLHFKIGDKWVKVKSVKIKARPFMGFNQSMDERYKKTLKEYYIKELYKLLNGGGR